MKRLFLVLTCLVAMSGCEQLQTSKNENSGQSDATGTTTTRQAAAQPQDSNQAITGTPARNSKFSNLRLGMSQTTVEKQIGPADDYDTYVTGKAFIPFYFGKDRSRFSAYYKGSGILTYAGGGLAGGHGELIRIHHNKDEDGDRSTKQH